MSSSAPAPDSGNSIATRKPGFVLRALNALILISIPLMVYLTYTDWQIRGHWYQVIINAGGALLVSAVLFGRFGLWNLSSSANRNLARIPATLATTGLVLWLAGTAVLINVFIDHDRCLDQGGRWAHKTQSCEK